MQANWITGDIITADDFNRCVMENVPAISGEVDIAEKHVCESCHGVTFDDSRGHCCACGAPRSIVAERAEGGLVMEGCSFIMGESALGAETILAY